MSSAALSGFYIPISWRFIVVMFNTTFYIAVFLFHHLLSAACMTVCLTIHSLVKMWLVVRVKDYLVCNLSKSNILSVRSHSHACIFSFSSSIHVHYLMDCIETRFLFFVKCKKSFHI